MLASEGNELITEVRVTDDALIVALADGRTLSVPLVWYPSLLNASEEERNEWRLIGDGEGIHWPQLDEDLSAAGLLHGIPASGARTHTVQPSSAWEGEVIAGEGTERASKLIGSWLLEATKHLQVDKEEAQRLIQEALDATHYSWRFPNATDAARAKAEELNVNLFQIEGTGSGGRITVRDVEAAAEARDRELRN